MGSVVGKVTGALGLDSMLGEGQAGSTGVNNFSSTGAMGDVNFNAATGASEMTMSPQMRALFDQGLGQAGAFGQQVAGAGDPMLDAGQGFLSQATQFDPYAAAEEQFSRLDAILEPGRKSARTGTAAGLLATGRLGGTSGNDAQAQVEGEIERQRQGMLSEQFASAQGVQDSMVNRALSLSQGGMGMKAGYQGLQGGALSQAMGIDSQLQALLSTGSNLTKTQAIAPTKSGTQEMLGGVMGALTSKI